MTPGSIGINSIDVAIGEVANATSYVLEYSKSANFASKTTKTYSSAGSRTITGLDADTTYYFRVKATAERFNESAWSTTLSATTLNPSATPLETPNIAALSGTKTAIVIKLDAVEGAQKYVVEYATDASFSDAVAKPYSSAGSKTISGLTTGTWYFVRVKATATGRADSPYTATRKIFTGGGYAMPAASFSAVKTSITLNIKAGKIDATQGAPEKYVIEYSENPDFSNAKTRTVTQGLNDDGTLKPCKPTISSLTFGTKYYIRVKAIGAAGNDSPWNSTSYTAGQLAVPSRFASSVGSDFVNVKCYNVTGMAGFEVMYSTSSDFSNPQYAQGPASGTVAVTGLQSSTKYYFKARALGDNVSRVNSAWSPSFSATTKEAVSSAVLDDDSSFENFFDEQDELDAFWDVLAKSIAR